MKLAEKKIANEIDAEIKLWTINGRYFESKYLNKTRKLTKSKVPAKTTRRKHQKPRHEAKIKKKPFTNVNIISNKKAAAEDCGIFNFPRRLRMRMAAILDFLCKKSKGQ